MITVLDKGYVRLVDHMGSDLTVVNAARASFMKSSDTMRPQDEKLLAYLTREVETEPFRHAQLQFEVYAPLMVARQWWKYAVGSAHLAEDEGHAWSESSRRYVESLTREKFPRSIELVKQLARVDELNRIPSVTVAP
jgi:thymidylate synthase (FAD)